MDILLLLVTHWDVTSVVWSQSPRMCKQPRRSPSYTLARRTSEPWKKPNTERFERQKTKPTVKDTLRYGGIKSIKEVFEAPTAQLGVGHATMLITLLHSVLLWGVIFVVALDTKIKTVGIHGNNTWGVSSWLMPRKILLSPHSLPHHLVLCKTRRSLALFLLFLWFHILCWVV